MKNKAKKCLGCHNKIEEEYFFCSITCACLCGFMHVRSDGEKRDMKELENQEVVDSFLNNPPIRGDYPDKERYL
jgi:ribosomal protein S26